MADLPTRNDFDDFAAWPGRAVLGPDGGRLGAVEAIFLDEATGVPEWVLVRLGDNGGGDRAFVPLAGARVEPEALRVEQEPGRVAAAPRPDVGETLSVAEERQLYEHYGLAYSEEASESLLPAEDSPAPEPPKPRLRRYEGTPPPIPIPEPAPRVLPPLPEERATRKLPVAGIAIGSAIAGLLVVLAWRAARR